MISKWFSSKTVNSETKKKYTCSPVIEFRHLYCCGNLQRNLISLKLILQADSHFTNHSLCCPLLLFLLLLPPFATTTGKTTPSSASTTYHGAAFPKEAGDPERGTGPNRSPTVGEQGSPDSEPISVEMEGKGEGCVSSMNLQGIALLGPKRL